MEVIKEGDLVEKKDGTYCRICEVLAPEEFVAEYLDETHTKIVDVDFLSIEDIKKIIEKWKE